MKSVDVPGYNDGTWHLIFNGPPDASGTVRCTWTSPANSGPGLYNWQATAEAFDTHGDFNGNDITSFVEYPLPQGVSLSANDGLLGVPITFRVRSNEISGNLYAMSLYVQGPGYPGWTNIGAVGASGSDAQGSFTWTPPSAGAWQVLLQTWDLNGNVNYPNMDVCNPVVPINVLASGGAPLDRALIVNSARLGNIVTMIGRGTDSNSNTQLSTFRFYVQGPANATGYNDGQWHLVSTVAASGTDATKTTTWQPPAPGAWSAMFQSWDANGAVDGSKTTRFLSLSPTAGNNAFQIMVDVNQINKGEADSLSQGNDVLSCDGVWGIVENSPSMPLSEWKTVLASIGSAKWAVSEDNPTSANEYNAMNSIVGRTIDASMNYQESNPYPNDTVLTLNQINGATANHGSSIVVLSRSYGDSRGAFVDMALTNPYCSGVVFECGVTVDYQGIALVAGINKVLNSGRRCYLLLPPRSNSTNYSQDVVNLLSTLAGQGVSLWNPNLYIVLAVYGRSDTGVAFLDQNNPTSTNNQNTIAGGVAALKQFRGY